MYPATLTLRPRAAPYNTAPPSNPSTHCPALVVSSGGPWITLTPIQLPLALDSGTASSTYTYPNIFGLNVPTPDALGSFAWLINAFHIRAFLSCVDVSGNATKSKIGCGPFPRS